MTKIKCKPLALLTLCISLLVHQPANTFYDFKIDKTFISYIALLGIPLFVGFIWFFKKGRANDPEKLKNAKKSSLNKLLHNNQPKQQLIQDQNPANNRTDDDQLRLQSGKNQSSTNSLADDDEGFADDDEGFIDASIVFPLNDSPKQDTTNNLSSDQPQLEDQKPTDSPADNTIVIDLTDSTTTKQNVSNFVTQLQTVQGIKQQITKNEQKKSDIANQKKIVAVQQTIPTHSDVSSSSANKKYYPFNLYNKYPNEIEYAISQDRSTQSLTPGEHRAFATIVFKINKNTFTIKENNKSKKIVEDLLLRNSSAFFSYPWTHCSNITDNLSGIQGNALEGWKDRIKSVLSIDKDNVESFSITLEHRTVSVASTFAYFEPHFGTEYKPQIEQKV